MQSRVGGNLFIPLFKPWDRNYTAETFTFQFTVSNLFQTVSRLGPETKKFLSLTLVREISLDLLYVNTGYLKRSQKYMYSQLLVIKH